MNRTKRRLSAEALARLLDLSSRCGLEPFCLLLIQHSGRGSRLYEQLCWLGGQAGGRRDWRFLAELLETVDGLRQRQGNWWEGLEESEMEGVSLGLLRAAAQVRCLDCRKKEEGAFLAMVEGLSGVLGGSPEMPAGGEAKPLRLG